MCVSFHSVHYLCVVYVYVNVEDIYNVYIDVSINLCIYIYIYIFIYYVCKACWLRHIGLDIYGYLKYRFYLYVYVICINVHICKDICVKM